MSRLTKMRLTAMISSKNEIPIKNKSLIKDKVTKYNKKVRESVADSNVI